MYEPVYLAGIAAGKATKTNKLGYVYAFPIPQTIANINAFELGAQSVNPTAQTYVVNTSNWCDPAKQAEAAKSLLAQGVDVITQHQDCTATITKAAEEAGKMVGRLPRRRLGAGPEGLAHRLGVGLGRRCTTTSSKTALAGKFTGSQVQRQLPGRLQGRRPTRSCSRSSARRSTADTQALIADEQGADLDDRLAVRRSGHRPGRHGRCSPPARRPTTPRSRRRTPSSSRASSARSRTG